MKGFEIKFNVYADSQEEADLATKTIIEFIGDNAAKGIPVTAKRIAEAVERWKDNYFVQNYFKR